MRLIVDQKNLFAGLLYMVIGLAVVMGGFNYSIGTTARMGSGYFPVLVGASLAVVGLVVGLGALSPRATRTRIEPIDPRPLGFVLLGVVCFALVLKPLGAGIAIVALTLISSLALRRRNWRQVWLTAIGLIPLAYLVFVALIGLRLDFLPASVGGW